MKIPKPFLFVFAALLAFGTWATPHARAQVSVSFFYDTLDPYGEWIQDPDYGYCWHPTGVADDWAPYTDGYWAYTDSGWTWVSYEDYGGVVYHYGRWAHIPGEGWVWVPGYTWAPAWVSWRTSDDYVGWAPLPPEARWSAGIGFGAWVDARFDIGPGFYCFVGVHDFGAPALGAVILSRDRNVEFISETTNITNITINNSTVYTGGPSYSKFGALSSRPIPRLKLVRETDASLVRSAGGKDLSHQQGDQLMVIAPKFSASAAGAHAKPPKVAKTITGVKADHGWDVVKDPQEREKLHAQIKDQAGSDTSSPAKPVNPEDVKLVTDKTKGSTLAGNATPTPAKTGKGTKKKTLSNADLLNAPATEGPGAATATPTPKSKKSKTPKVSSESENGPAGESPTPKPKSKKSRTPSSEETSSSSDETPSKHSKQSSDSNLQPFLGGDNSSAPETKTKKSSEDTGKSDEIRQPDSSAGQPEAKTSGKEKSDKDKKGKGETTPPGN